MLISKLILAASTSATSAVWWRLFNIYLVLSIVFSAFFIAWILYLVISTREKPGREVINHIKPGIIPSSTRGRPRNVAFLVLFLVVVFFGLYIYSLPATYYIRQAPSSTSNTLTIDVYAAQWTWTFRYPNGYNVTGSANVKNYTAEFPVNTTIIFRVTSLDVMHEFSIPTFKVKVDAFPGVWNTIWTNVYQQGTYTAFCTELCGLGHADMYVHMQFVSVSTYNAWIASQK
ncbi:MAG: hypothetical protein KIY11_03090 [Thermoplasmata archaeon]|nr:hypothetical protein [Candidatus Sysuiplasma acidicola]